MVAPPDHPLATFLKQDRPLRILSLQNMNRTRMQGPCPGSVAESRLSRPSSARKPWSGPTRENRRRACRFIGRPPAILLQNPAGNPAPASRYGSRQPRAPIIPGLRMVGAGNAGGRDFIWMGAPACCLAAASDGTRRWDRPSRSAHCRWQPVRPARAARTRLDRLRTECGGSRPVDQAAR